MTQSDYDDPSRRRSRRQRSLITILGVLLLLFFATWYALSYFRTDVDRSAGGTTTSQSPACTMSPQQVQVNVYNATDRDGLAGRVANQLKDRGFSVKTVANDPKKATLKGRGELRYGSRGRTGADLVGLHTGSFTKVQDVRTRTSVDVVLGPGFQQLASTSSITPC